MLLATLVMTCNEYNLSTAWDLSTASYSQNFSFQASETTSPLDLYF